MSDIVQLTESTGALTRARIAAYVELTKPRIGGLVLFVTALGFYLALPPAAGLAAPMLLPTLLGTALVASGANALNQVLESKYDRLMVRTQDRPIPSGRLTRTEALAFALTISIVGVVGLACFVNALTAGVAAFSVVSYVLMYTPLKRMAPWCVFVGAVSGALPPVIGWTAAAGTLSLGALLPFAILFFWQLPHFASIAWLYRDDYGRAGYPMLPVVDRNGSRTNRHLLVHSVWLLIASLVPTLLGLTGTYYAIGAAVLGLAFFGFGVRFTRHHTREAARLHVLASVVYLPLLFALMILDKTPVS